MELIDDEEMDAETISPEQPEGETPVLDDGQEKQQMLLSDSEELLEKWKLFAGTGVVRAVYRLPGMFRKAEQILKDKDKLTIKIDNMIELLGRTKAAEQAFWEVGIELKDITFTKTYRHVASIASTFAILWPLAMVFMGAIVEYLLKAILAKMGDFQIVSLLGGDYKFESFFKDLMNLPLGETLLAIPKYFPGGAVFFWSAVIYTVFAVITWRKAKRRLKEELTAKSD